MPGAAQPRAPDADGAPHRGYLAARLVDGELEVIDERNATARFVPASVLKVATVAAALEHLGPDYRWVTRLTSSAAVEGPVLAGDLVIEPGADPTWERDAEPDPLATLALQLRARGVTRVAGDLVVDTDRFPGRLHPLDRARRRPRVPGTARRRRRWRSTRRRSPCAPHRESRSAPPPASRPPTTSS